MNILHRFLPTRMYTMTCRFEARPASACPLCAPPAQAIRGVAARAGLLLASLLALPSPGLAAPPQGNPGDAAAEVPTLAGVTVSGDSDAGAEGPVHGYVAEQSRAGTKTATPILETPQSISVITRGQMDVQQPASASQALRYTAGAYSEKYGGFGGQLDLTRIRGVDADYYLDGLRMITNVSTWTTQVDPFALERVEVLRGPASAVYGQGTGGGIVNQVSRRPQAESAHEINLQMGNFGRRQIAIDTTGPLDQDGQWLYRLTAIGLDAKGQVEDVRHQRVYLAPALTWRPTASTSWTLLATHSREPEIPDYNSLPAVALGLNGSPYPRVDRRRNYTDMDFQGSSRKQDSISSLFSHDFGNGWSFNSNMRYMYVDSDIQRTSIYGYQNRAGHLWLEGTYGLAPASSNTFSADNNLTGSFDLGPTRHTLLLGVDYAKGTLRNDSYRMDPVAFDPYDPDHYRPVATPDFTDSRTRWPYNVRQRFDRVGVYAQDQVAYAGWRLTLSARHDSSRTEDESRSYSPVWKRSEQKDRKWSTRAGLGYVFDNGLSPYFSYATSFDPVLGNDYGGSAFKPTEATQYEAGVKFQPANSSTMLSAAVFQLNQTNVKTSDTRHLGYWTQSGEVRSRGVELQANTRLAPGLNLIASYAYPDNQLVKDAAYRGKSLAQTPRHSASAWVDYRVGGGPLAGLLAGVGVRYLGSTYGDPANTFKVPAVTLLDMAVSYDLARLSPGLRGASLGLNVSNLTNKHYVASCVSAMYCFIGQDRSAVATLSYRW